MRVCWVQDYSRDGGAELSNRHVVYVGTQLGFDIVGITPQNFHPELFYQADVLVLNNLFSFNPEQFRAIEYAIYEGRVPYVKYEHDSRELQRPTVASALFANSVMNVFLSPKHLEAHQDVFGCAGEILPLGIDTDLFQVVPEVERIPGSAFVPNAFFQKKIGAETARYVEEHPEMQFFTLGHAVDGIPDVRPWQALEEMPALYSSAERVVHLPEFPCAGERVVLEARLCGCSVEINDNVGYGSGGLDLTDTDALRATLGKAPYTFWKNIEERVQ